MARKATLSKKRLAEIDRMIDREIARFDRKLGKKQAGNVRSILRGVRIGVWQ